MTAVLFDFASRQRIDAPPIRTHLPELAIPWWHCPDFCDDTCYGGTGPADLEGRTHFKTILGGDFTDIKAGDEAHVSIEVSAVEYDGTGYETPTAVSVEVDGHAAYMSADDAEQVANAILTAVAIARQPLPTITRSPLQGGGRASTPLQAS